MGRGVDRWGWADCIQSLVERGHSLSDVRGYTLAQLRAFSEAADRARRMELADTLTIQRAATYATADFNALLKRLTE